MKRRARRTNGTKTARQTTRRIHKACIDNLTLYLQGVISYEEWERRQEELESRLTPAPELPLLTEDPLDAHTPGAA